MIWHLAGWLAVIALLFAALLSAARGIRERAAGPVSAAGIFALPAVIILAVLGAVVPVPAAILSGLAAVAVAAAVLLGRQTAGDVLGHVAEGLGVAGGSLRGMARWSRSQVPSLVSRAGLGTAPGEAVPIEAVAEHVAARGIPSVMEDPHLGAPPEPADLASPAVPVPAPWAALAEWIATREPADDLELRMFSDGDAAGALAVADARHAYAETLLNGAGLSPAYVAGELEAGDGMAEHATVLAMIYRRYLVIYGQLKEWVSAHGNLPKDGNFLTGDM